MSDPPDFSPVKRALLEIRQLRARLAAAQPAKPSPVAIVGAAVRLPGGVSTLDAFWELLEADRDAITLTPASRWDADAIYSEHADEPGKTYSRHGAFLDDVADFDAEFFGISPREAESIDPQHRLLLELTWEALENAAISPASVAGTKTGVFIGLCNSDYGRMVLAERDEIDAYSSFGIAGSIASGRISYFLNARGPSVVVDTACSSSLTAVHLACNSLALHEADAAIAGAANLMLTPDATMSFTKARMLARDGQCKTFDADADGYVRGEGCAVVILKRLADAQAAGDPILAVIRGSAMNHDGRSAGLTAPNGPAQEAVIRAALADAAVSAGDVDYVEAHGTGTSLGDPIELQALANAYGPAHGADRPLAIGSLKTKLGHLEAVAGLAGVIKTALALERERLPPHRNVVHPTALFAWDDAPLEIVRETRAWPRASRPRIAAVSAFGFSGTNVHAVIEEAPRVAAEADPAHEPRLFCLSARSEAALRELARRCAASVARSSEPIAVLCRSANVGRAHLRHRLAVRVTDEASLVHALEAWLAGSADALLSGVAADPVPQVALDAEVATSALLRENGVVTAQSRPTRAELLGTLAELYVAGVPIDWSAIDGPGRRCGDLPTYPFERTTFWRPRSGAAAMPASGAEWPRIVAAVHEQSESGPLGWDLASYDSRWARFDELAAGVVTNLFASIGAFRAAGERRSVDDLIAAYAIKPLYRNLLRRWLRLLVRQHALREDGDAFVSERPLRRADLTALSHEVERFLVDDPGLLGYLRRSVARLGELLTGRTSPLDVLFERGEMDAAESAYERSPASRYLNAMVAAAVRAARNGPGAAFRLLEAGAGTGGTTTAVAPCFPDHGEYWFTDVSDAFLARARAKFSAHPAFRFARFDLDRNPPPELAAGSFDVVLAANVVHAARDAGAAIDRMRELLQPGGVLILRETTRYHGLLDLTIAFVDGWNAFDDAYRTDRPLLAADRWTSLLTERGFADVERFPKAGSPGDAVGEHVIVARTTGTAPARTATIAAPIARAAGAAESPAIAVPELAGASIAEQRERLRAFVTACVRDVLRLDRDRALGLRERFTDLGMDSLMALKLKSTLGEGLGIDDRLAATIAFDTGTVEELAEQVLALIAPPDGASAPAVVQTIPANGVLVTAEALAGQTDAEVEALLMQRLREGANAVQRG